MLDAGCGVGGVTRALVARGGRVIALESALGLRPRPGAVPVHAVVGTLVATAFASGTFDVVLSSEAVEHTPDPREAVRELYRLVRPGGVLCALDAQPALAGASPSGIARRVASL